MTKIFSALWCGISITVGLIGLGSVAKFGELNTVQQVAVGVLIVLLMLGSGYFGWMLADEQMKKGSKSNADEVTK